jgi:hypothetical protein
MKNLTSLAHIMVLALRRDYEDKRFLETAFPSVHLNPQELPPRLGQGVLPRVVVELPLY